MVIQGTRVLQGWIHYWRMLILSSTKRAREEATTVTIPIYKLFGTMTKHRKFTVNLLLMHLDSAY